MKQYWLMKSEPEVYSIDDLKRDKKTLWTGVRNYQARNYMMGEAVNKELGKPALGMREGDLFLFYHSNAEPAACVGIGRIERVNVADPEQFNKKNEMFEPKATKEKPMWFCCEVAFVEKFATPVALNEIREQAALKNMVLLQKGSRLSVQPVASKEFEVIQKLAKA